MATSGSFLDESGLSYFWSKLKTRFENINTRITKIDGSVSNIEDALAELIDTGAKNKANPLAAENYNNQGAYPIQAGGVKYTYDSSTGAITTSQQAGNSTTTLKIPITLVVGTEYVVRGCPDGGSDTGYRLDVRKALTTNVVAIDYGEDYEGPLVYAFTATQTNYDLCIRYYKNSAANETFYPMVAQIDCYSISQKFVKYRPGLDELYAMIQNQ